MTECNNLPKLMLKLHGRITPPGINILPILLGKHLLAVFCEIDHDTIHLMHGSLMIWQSKDKFLSLFCNN